MYTITKNPQFNSLEISFDGKPAEEIREALKALRFRWHSIKRVWYGYSDETTIREAIDGKATVAKKPAAKKAEPKAKAEKVNKYGVKVGDIFCTSWGYEQTQSNFFQVVAICGESSVRVREVYLPLIDREAVSSMSEDRTFQVVREILPAAEHAAFIKDQEKGDIKRLKSYAADGVSNPQFNLTSYANAYIVNGDSIKVYESWYA